MVRTKRPSIDVDAIDPNSSYAVSQVASLLAFHPESVRRLIKEGRIDAFQPMGYEWRIPGKEVLRIRETRQHNGGQLDRPDPLEGIPCQVIYVTPEQMMKMFPGWQPAPEEEAEDVDG